MAGSAEPRLAMPRTKGSSGAFSARSSRCGQTVAWCFLLAVENGPFIDDFPIKTSIHKGFSMAMLNNKRVAEN